MIFISRLYLMGIETKAFTRTFSFIWFFALLCFTQDTTVHGMKSLLCLPVTTHKFLV